MSVRRRMTAEDLWRLGEGDARQELVDGEVIERPPVGGEVGFVLALPYDLERVRAADVAFIAADRLPNGRLPEGFVRGAPDLVVEVLSPSDNPIDVQTTVRDWLEGGARGEDVLPGLLIPLVQVLG